MPLKRILGVTLLLLALLAATWQRARAVERLPPDYDELIYLPVAYRYAELLSGGRWGELAAYRENFEHPPLVKLLYALELLASGTPEPDWKTVRVGRPIPEPAVPVFRWTRWLSAGMGILQVGLTGLVHPVGALLLAFDAYHAKYTAQAYLEGVPGLFAILSVLAFERARRRALEAGQGRPFQLASLALSGALLGVAAAGKYPYAMVVGLAFLPFLIGYGRARGRVWAAFVLPAMATFLIANPALWSNPVGNLWASLTFHWNYSHSEHVVRSALPWYQPLYYLTHATPVRWHAGVFATGATVWVLLPLAAMGFPATLRQRPVWAAWALVGLVFLLLWSTKWPQYLLLILPALSVCAGMGVSTLYRLVASAVRRRAVGGPQSLQG
ncbi:hypothetical protein F0U60_16630 [Archangium minus]|uniref:Glycosyltransferase RgtA/B/C/D-like domain-containing protein n=1 Tax=Archangium minus TaxID=83450 RepID=A0ABY9WP06_9BACT|nr:hypothetical protein F0U60_16630 [Archangium minus]